MKSILVTGGAGFIGSAFVRMLVNTSTVNVVTVDSLTYSGSLLALSSVQSHPRHVFHQTDICDEVGLREVFKRHQPMAVVNFAAQTHVDRSIDSPWAFVNTNLVGTFTLLQVALDHWRDLAATSGGAFRFLHVSTDEVFGTLEGSGTFNEMSPYAPSSPYAATKAGADHLVRAWTRTYGFPALITNASNNYGPFQFPEKLIPLIIEHAISGHELPVYGHGRHVRDWIYVDDHCRALLRVLERGIVGETYVVGASNERQNIDVVNAICDLVDELHPDAARRPRRNRIAFVPDRAGHDFRYALDASRIRKELGWAPQLTFADGLRQTVQWYLDNQEWCRHMRSRSDEHSRVANGPPP